MNLLLAALSQPWALEEGTFRALTDVVERHAAGIRLSADEIRAVTNARNAGPTAGMQIVGTTAVIPVVGVIARHSSMVNNVSQPQGTSVEAIRADFRAALADPLVESIVFDVDSPGGSVAGVPDLADEIAASTKPTSAYTDGMMASAAYWLMSGVDRITASRTAQVGSIGVYAAVRDTSAQDAMKGVRTVLVRSGQFKGSGMPGTVLEDGAIADLRDQIGQFAQLFFDAVQAGREFTPDQLAAIKEGQVFLGDAALRKGLVDAIESAPAFQARLSNPNPGAKAMNENQPTAAATAAATLPADPAAASAAALAPAAPAAPAAAAADPVAAERARISELLALGARWPSFKATIEACIADGSPVSVAKDAILLAASAANQQVLEQRQAAATAPAAQAAAQAATAGNSGDPIPARFDADAVKARFEAGHYGNRYSSVAQAIDWERAAYEANQAGR